MKDSNIDYTPDYDKFLERTKRRTRTEQLHEILLPEFPYETFPLPNLHAKLRVASKEIYNWHGFEVIRGVPVDSHSREENIVIFAGISAHIAPLQGRQDRQDNNEHSSANVVLAHVEDLISAHSGSVGAPAYNAEKQVFHTDIGDIVALFALGEAADATRPDLIWTLAEPWAADTFGKPNRPYRLTPLLFYQSASPNTPERVVIQFTRRSFTAYRAGGLLRSSEISPITEAQAEALDALQYTAEKYAVSLDYRRGDIQYVNNLGILHARGSFRDSPEKQRHLVRLWLRDPEHMWEMSAARERWDRIYEGVTPETSVFPLEPRRRRASRGVAQKGN
ncbi:hypothetical protein B0T25DRAFT_594467 [Lasiosphaeria hispida]|uniref:TauD/TfdA-like domain-containing protein n=1 Tax=Lasiosphaeria hispida TaxID=260671 RepID=A0AAJ0H5M6_9PEZI|nr:hypothetical protein B0T25DRAFT_594467 [Lasiosphaeria hispida]